MSSTRSSTRKTMTTRGKGRTISNAQTNNDHCDACTYGGRMMCCDGCPKAFHFTCLVPPLDVDNPPTGNWYCRECSAESTRQSQQRGRKARRKGNLFKELKEKARVSNPKSFTLPENIRNTFDGIFVGKHGEYRDANKEKPVQIDKKGYPAEPDREKFTDSKGKRIRCYNCKLPPKHLKPVMSCDFCDQYWHFDCLTPPLTIAPPLHKRWMCPLHADHVLPPMRRLRGEEVLPYLDNTSIEFAPEKRRVECDPEFYLNDTLHRLPKQSFRLGWIEQLKAAMEVKAEEVLQTSTDAEKVHLSKKEGKKPEVSPQKPDKGKRKEFFRGNEVPVLGKGKGKETAHDEGKGEEFVSIKTDENEFETSPVSPALLPTTLEDLLDEEAQVGMAIELSRGEYNDKAGPSGSNEDEKVANQLQPVDYELVESSVISFLSANLRIQSESKRSGDDNKRGSFMMGERATKRPRQDNQDNNYGKGSIVGSNNNETANDEGNPLFLLVEAAFGGL